MTFGKQFLEFKDTAEEKKHDSKEDDELCAEAAILQNALNSLKTIEKELGELEPFPLFVKERFSIGDVLAAPSPGALDSKDAMKKLSHAENAIKRDVRAHVEDCYRTESLNVVTELGSLPIEATPALKPDTIPRAARLNWFVGAFNRLEATWTHIRKQQSISDELQRLFEIAGKSGATISADNISEIEKLSTERTLNEMKNCGFVLRIKVERISG